MAQPEPKNRLAILTAALLALVLVWAWGPIQARAAQPAIGRVIVTNTAEDLLVYFNVSHAFENDRLVEIIMAGVPTTFTYKVELEEVHSFWPDKLIKEVELSRTIHYDAVAGRFTIKYINEKTADRTTSDWRAAQELMTDLEAIKVLGLAKLKKNQTYRLRIRAQMLKPVLPTALNIFFFWVPLGDVETEWYEVEFRR